MKLPKSYSTYNPVSNITWLCSHEQQGLLSRARLTHCTGPSLQIKLFTESSGWPWPSHDPHPNQNISASRIYPEDYGNSRGKKKWTAALKTRNHGHVLIKLHWDAHPSHEEHMLGACLAFQEPLCCSFGRPWQNLQQNLETKADEKASLKSSIPTIPHYLFKVHKGKHQERTPTWKKQTNPHKSEQPHTIYRHTNLSTHWQKSLILVNLQKIRAVGG